MQKSRLLLVAVLGFFLITLLSFGVFAQINSKAKLTNSLLEKTDKNLEGNFVVNMQIKESLSLEEFNSLADKIGREKVSSLIYPYVIQAELTGSEVLEVARERDIISIEEDFEIRPLLQDSVEIVEADAAWEKTVNGINLDGAGQSVCVIDTGVNLSHPALEGSNFLGCQLDCIDDINATTFECALDCGDEGDIFGHGTAVAGAAAARGGIDGIAKGVNLISLRASNNASTGTFDSTAIWRGIDWCVDNFEQYDISAISISAGTSQTFDSYCDDVSPLYEFFINRALNENIAVVIASGNSGNSPVYGEGISLPACMPSAIPVAATNKMIGGVNDSVWSGSSYNDLVKLFAPGAFINTTQNDGGYDTVSGTSISAPMVSAAFAIVNQYLELNGEGARSMHPFDLEQTFLENGEQIYEWDFVSDPVPLPMSSWTRININNVLLEFDSIAPEINLNSPANGETVGRVFLPSGIQFNCEVSDWQLSEVTFELRDEFNSIIRTETRNVSGEVADEVFSVYLDEGTYYWGCEAVDANDNIASELNSSIVHVELVDPSVPTGLGTKNGRSFVR